jgi:hypothetical protein
MPAISLSNPHMWVRSHNGSNDSRQKPVKAIPVAPLDATGEALFRERYAIDADQVRRSFARA